jgi:hypothetical protein
LPKLDLNFEDFLHVGFLVSQAVAHWTLPGYTYIVAEPNIELLKFTQNSQTATDSSFQVLASSSSSSSSSRITQNSFQNS